MIVDRFDEAWRVSSINYLLLICRFLNYFCDGRVVNRTVVLEDTETGNKTMFYDGNAALSKLKAPVVKSHQVQTCH